MSTPEISLDARLTELGLTAEQTAKIKELGATEVEDLKHLKEEDLITAGVPTLKARRLLASLTPVPVVDPNAELGEDEAPSKDRMVSFAGATGIDPSMLMLFMNGGARDLDLSGMMPIPTMVAGYNPKRRDMYLMVMGQIESRLSVPIIVINDDGVINRELTIEYIEGLEEGRDPAENNIYFGSDGTPHEVIRVGVDANSIYDADPLEPSKALQKSGMGIGRINWHNVPLDVRQVAYFAATQTNEIDLKNDGHLSWLRDNMKPGARRLVFHGQAPRAISEYNEAARTGSLPTLRVMLSRGPRRAEAFPRRRRTTPHDLSGIGSNSDPREIRGRNGVT